MKNIIESTYYDYNYDESVWKDCERTETIIPKEYKYPQKNRRYIVDKNDEKIYQLENKVFALKGVSIVSLIFSITALFSIVFISF